MYLALYRRWEGPRDREQARGGIYTYHRRKETTTNRFVVVLFSSILDDCPIRFPQEQVNRDYATGRNQRSGPNFSFVIFCFHLWTNEVACQVDRTEIPLARK
jgi:hypothetical protein